MLCGFSAGRREWICRVMEQTSDPAPHPCRTAVLIIRGATPAHQHQHIGQFPTRPLWWRNPALAGAGFAGFWHRQTPEVLRCWEGLAKKEALLQPLSCTTPLLGGLCRHSGPPKFLLIHPDESPGLWSIWNEQLSKSSVHLL